jgi:hypothetical protein
MSTKTRKDSMAEVTWNGEWHPFAERFPMLSERELRDMAESIKETGQLHACVMNPDGLGLDGRNRVAACRIAGVEPAWVVNGGNPMSIIIAANVHHRFLSTGQRAMAVAVELVDKGLRQKGRWKRGSIPDAPPDSMGSHNTWLQAVSNAGVVLDWLPDLADEVLGGDVALDAAFTRAKDKRDIETANAEKLTRLPDDLAALVDSGVRDIDGALAEVRDRETVARIDKARNADGAPAPTFGDRAEEGSITWNEAATLARQWQEERTEAIFRNQDRLRQVISGWSAVQTVVASPENPYVQAIVDGLGERDQEELDLIIKQIAGA